MMDRDNECTIDGCIFELLSKPALLFKCSRAIQASILFRVESDEGRRWGLDRPMVVGLRHRRAVFEQKLRARSAKVLHEATERRFIIRDIAGASTGVAIVISRDGKYGRVVVLVGLIKLNRVIGAHSIEIDYVSKVVEEYWL